MSSDTRSTGRWTPHLPDLVLVLVASLLILLEIFAFQPAPGQFGRAAVGLVAAGSLATVRSRPFASYLVNGAAVYGLIALGQPSNFYQWTNLAALFVAATRVTRGRALLVLVLGWAGVTFYFIRFTGVNQLPLAGASLVTWSATWFAGRSQYSRTRELEVTRQRDVTKAELETQRAHLELERERTRIARDLHDVIGHAVNVMVVHAGAGEGAIQTNPIQARKAFATIADTGRKALADLDRMLDLLRGEAETRPIYGVADLKRLCDGVRNPDLGVSLVIEGDVNRISPSLGATLYRICQEALTNVIKHSNARNVQVTIRLNHGLMLEVADDGIGGSGSPGRGLLGIEERARLHVGTVEYGPKGSGGFSLRCRFPLEAT